VFNTTFNNISVISLRSVLLVEETGGPWENHRPVASHIMLYTSPWLRFELTTSVVIITDCICSCKSNYHTITATTAPGHFFIVNINMIFELFNLLKTFLLFLCFLFTIKSSMLYSTHKSNGPYITFRKSYTKPINKTTAFGAMTRQL